MELKECNLFGSRDTIDDAVEYWEQIDNIVPDIAWDVLDNAGMDRKTVNTICYGEDCDEW